MQSNIRAEEVLRAIANGKTLAAAGESIGVSGGRARQLLNRICRKLGLPDSVLEIRAQKERYLEKIGPAEFNPIIQLQPKVAQNLAEALGIKSADGLTPKYLSNVTAGQLIAAGLTIVAVAEAQEWLVRNGESLKRRPPENESEVKAVRRAINVLDAYHFDTNTIRAQLAHLQEGDV